MKALFAFLLIALFGAAAYLGQLVSKMRPRLSPGTAIQLGKWRFGDHEFEVWQRKNKSVLEPFTDGLFVRYGTNDWEAYTFDIQDDYSPKIELRETNGIVEVFRDAESRGIFDTSNRTFHAGSNTAVFTPQKIGQNVRPPGGWGL